MTFGDFADWCSVAGLAVTIFLTVSAGLIKRRYEKVIFYPRHMRKVEEHINIISILVRNRAASLGTHESDILPKLKAEIGAMRGDLNFLRKISDKQIRQLVDGVISSLEAFSVNHERSRLNNLMERASQLRTELENVSERLRF